MPAWRKACVLKASERKKMFVCFCICSTLSCYDELGIKDHFISVNVWGRYYSCTLLHEVRVCIRISLPASVWCVTVLLLLLADAVRYHVRDGKICSRGSLHLIPMLSFSYSNTFFFQRNPWQYCRIFSGDCFAYNTYHTSRGYYGHARSRGRR